MANAGPNTNGGQFLSPWANPSFERPSFGFRKSRKGVGCGSNHGTGLDLPHGTNRLKREESKK